MQPHEFYSNGKLLITGEYTVLDGAIGLALPTKQGQYLTINAGNDKSIVWTAFNTDNSIWYFGTLLFDDILANRQNSVSHEHNTLINILHEADKLNPGVLQNSNGFTVTTSLTFPKNWGLGTSSTLINNIAQWFKIDAFELLNKSFGGSGYDIACAQNNSPILYELKSNHPTVIPVTFRPAFADNLYFVYLNKKQNSRDAIAAYREKRSNLTNVIQKINTLTQSIVKAATLPEFCKAIDEHERIMSQILETPTAKEKLFPDFRGSIKSLGAWGGDFVLAASENDPEMYFKECGYDVVIAYRDMILNAY